MMETEKGISEESPVSLVNGKSGTPVTPAPSPASPPNSEKKEEAATLPVAEDAEKSSPSATTTKVESESTVAAATAETEAAATTTPEVDKKEESGKNEKSNKVILHTFQRGKTCPSVSPFSLKLETYLRMAEIPYELDTSKPFGKKGKAPWITIDGVEVCDSQLCIEYLNKKFEKSLWGEATKVDKAVAQSMRVMLEDRFLCALAEWRWITNSSKISEIMDFSGIKYYFAKLFVGRQVKNALWTQGILRHSEEDRFNLLKADLMAVVDYLGDKAYFLGDTPTEIDCTIFGVMAQFIWCAPGSPFEQFIKEKCPTIVNFCERMKDKYYPDWDQLIGTNKSK